MVVCVFHKAEKEKREFRKGAEKTRVPLGAIVMKKRSIFSYN